MKDTAELYKRSENNELIEHFDLKTVANDFLTLSPSTRRDYYVKFRGKIYDNAEAVKTLRDTVDTEEF
jgi:hypothetical protein